MYERKRNKSNLEIFDQFYNINEIDVDKCEGENFIF